MEQKVPTTDKSLFVLIGPPAVGKTTWIKSIDLDATTINRDSIVEGAAARHGLTYDESFVAPSDDAVDNRSVEGMEKFGFVVPSDLPWRKFDFSLPQTIHREVFEDLDCMLHDASKDNKSVIIDMTNMVKADRTFYMQHFGDDFRRVAVLFDFQGDRVVREIKQRCIARHNELVKQGKSKNIPGSAIDRMIAAYEPPSVQEGFAEIIADDILSLMLKNPKWNLK